MWLCKRNKTLLVVMFKRKVMRKICAGVDSQCSQTGQSLADISRAPPACLERSMISFASKPSESCEHNSQALVSKSDVRGRPRLGVTYCTLLRLLTKEGGHLIHLIVPVWGTFLNFSNRCCNAGKCRLSISSQTDPSKMGSKTQLYGVTVWAAQHSQH